MDKERAGELLVLSAAFLWALFPIITKIIYNNISVLHTAGLSALFGAIFFLIVSCWKKTFPEWKNKKAYAPVMITTLIIGVAFYGLIFFSLNYTTASNVAILSLMEVFFTIIVLRILKKEMLDKRQTIGSVLMVLGAFLIMVKAGFSFNKGDLIVIAATAIAPFGNYYAKRAREYVSSSTIMLFRNLTAGIIFLAVGSLISPTPSFTTTKASILLLVINGLILFGAVKLMWLESIHRILIGKAISLNAVSPLFTLIFAFILLKEIPTMWQIMGFIIVSIGVYLLTKRTKLLNHNP